MTGNASATSPAKIWEEIYTRLRDEVDSVVFNPWLAPLSFVEISNNVVHLAHTSAFRRDWVVNTYEDYLLDLWREADSKITAVEIVVDKQAGQQREPSTFSRPEPVVEYIVENKPISQTEKALEPVRQTIGRVGVWSRSPYFYGPDQATNLAATAEELGYSALWIPGFDGGHIFERCGLALAATSNLAVATGIVNIWRHDPAEVADKTSKLRADSNNRFLVGLGGSHKFLIGDAYDKISPLAKMNNYLDALDAAGLPEEDRLLGALGPKMLRLSGQRSAGAHPCFIPPEFTIAAREILGDGPLLMPQVMVVMDEDPVTARAYAPRFASLYFKGPNYANMLRRFGFSDEDFAGEGSDRLIDGVVAWGSPDTIAARVKAHLDAGADHVTIESRGTVPEADVWRELAPRILN